MAQEQPVARTPPPSRSLPHLPSDIWNYIFTFIAAHEGIASRFVKFFRALPQVGGWPAHPPYKEVLADAASRGSLPLLHFLCDKLHYPLIGASEACIGAARGGHISVLEWLQSQNCRWNPCAAIEAAFNGHLHALKWLQEHSVRLRPAC